MASKKTKDAQEMSELHKLLGITPAEVRQELIDQGIDPEAEVAALRRLGQVLAAKFAPQIERERLMRLAPAAKPFRRFEETVACGAPVWAEGSAAPEAASLLDVIAETTPEDAIWARVAGWSMRDEGINDGDMVLVNTKAEARDGDLVLAHLEGQGQVVKRLRKHRDHVVLESANPDFAPIVVEDPAILRIHGVVVGRAGKV